MNPPVFLNGRFLGQAVTGVQRFSVEIASAIDDLIHEGAWPETTLLTPPGTMCRSVGGGVGFGQIQVQDVGRRGGHAWEQTDLPRAARGGVLLSLGNTGPVLAGRRQVVVIHDAGVFDTPGSYSLRFRLWYKTLQRMLVRAGARLVTVSQFSRARIAARLGLDPETIAVTYEGADHILRLAPEPGTLERFGLRRGRYALVVGSRVAHKNLAGLRGVAEILRQRDMVIAMVGGSNAEVFQGIGGLGDVGRHLGRTTDAQLRALYEGAACLLFPSRYEGFGLPPAEAMACGCPVVSSKGGAVEEICGDAALYADPAEPKQLIDAVIALQDQPGLSDQLAARGIVRAQALSWRASAGVLATVVRSL